MRRRPRETTSRIALRVHPPERGRRPEATLYVGTCCTCCCCLHVVGGLAGAAVGTFYPRDKAPGGAKPPVKLADDEIAGSASERPERFPLGTIYWSVALVGTGLVIVGVASAFDRANAMLILAIFQPLTQLGATVLAALSIAARPAVRRDGRSWRRLGWITLGSVLGFLAGVLLVYLMPDVLEYLVS